MRTVLFILLTLVVSVADGLAQETDVAVEDLQWSAVVSEAEAEFEFPRSRKQQWSWYRKETPANRLEYSWFVTIGEERSGYQLGTSLFVPPEDNEPMEGTLDQLLEACQNDLWELSETGGEVIGDFGPASSKDGRVKIRIADPGTLKFLFKTKPKTLNMSFTTPEFAMRQRVVVVYKDSQPQDKADTVAVEEK